MSLQLQVASLDIWTHCSYMCKNMKKTFVCLVRFDCPVTTSFDRQVLYLWSVV